MNRWSKLECQNEKAEDPPDPNRNARTYQRPLNVGEQRSSLVRRMLVALVLAAAGAVGTWLASNGCKFCDTFFERPEMTRESNLNPVLDLLLGSK